MGHKQQSISDAEARLRASEAGWGVALRFMLLTMAQSRVITVSGIAGLVGAIVYATTQLS